MNISSQEVFDFQKLLDVLKEVDFSRKLSQMHTLQDNPEQQLLVPFTSNNQKKDQPRRQLTNQDEDLKED